MNAEALSCWDTNAAAWDEDMGDSGNDYFKVLELPALTRLACVEPGERALDLATGNGLVARWLASQGAHVVATDGSRVMLEHAKRRDAGNSSSVHGAPGITYKVLDVTDPARVEAFVDAETAMGQFDAIIMNMAIMDVPTLEPLAAALPKLLKPNTGRFVATILHPIFTAGVTRVVETTENPETGREEATYSVKLTRYLNVPCFKDVAVKGQPSASLTFHRPLHELFADFFSRGLVLDALEEPNFDEAYEAHLANNPHLETRSLRQLTQLPKVLAFRMRVAGQASSAK